MPRLVAEVIIAGAMTTADEPTQARRKHGRIRGLIAALLVFLCCISLLGAVIGVWARRSFLDTERFVDRVQTVIDDPAVQEAVSEELTRQMMLLLRPAERLEDVLPVDSDLVAGLLTSSVEGFVEDRVQELVASDGFEQLFLAVVGRAHALALRILEGDTEVLESAITEGENGEVTLNLIPLVNELLRRISEASPTLLGREIDIPEVTIDEEPGAAIARLEDLLEVDLDENFGQVTVYNRGRLDAVQDGLKIFNQLAIALVVATLVFGAGALLVSQRRRRTTLQLVVGSALTLVLLRRVLFRVAEDIHEVPKVEVNKDAAVAIVDKFIDSLLVATGVMLGVLAVVLLVALLTGPYGWAQSLREQMTGRAPDGRVDPAGGWIGGHREAVQIGIALLGVVALWAFNLSWLGVLVVIVVVGVLELLVQRIGALPSDVTPSGSTGA